MRCKILVCCHKKGQFVSNEPYTPIQVGKSISDTDLGILGDDTGDNISFKNENYCELTGLYWAWKNLKDVDIIGLCHYRRYFDFHRVCDKCKPYTCFPVNSYDAVDFSVPHEFLEKIEKGDVIVPRKHNLRTSLYLDFCEWHYSKDIKALDQIIERTQTDVFKKAYFKVVHQGNHLFPYNMFIMRKHSFDNYCSWLFPILSDFESSVDMTGYDNEQKRLFGYVAERLFNVWLFAQGSRVVELPVIWFNDGKDPMVVYTPLRYKLRSIINDFAIRLLV